MNWLSSIRPSGGRLLQNTMGDPVDSLSKRHCSLSEFDDGGCLEEDGEITVIEIGGQRTVGELITWGRN